MKGVHGPGPKRGSMDQGSMFCPLPLINQVLELFQHGVRSENLLEIARSLLSLG